MSARLPLAAALAVTGALATAGAAAAADPTVAAAGDIACSPSDPLFNGGLGGPVNCAQQRTSNLLGGASAVLAVGDNQYNSGGLNDYLASYDKSWDRFKGVTSPVPGNHEYGTSGAGGYFSYFGARAGTRGKGWYSFDVGAWHVLALNSECDRLAGACASGGAQEAFVRQELAAHRTACTLAFWHEPRFSSGSAPVTNAQAMAPIWNDLYNGNADLVIAAHKHFYERLAPLNTSGNVDLARGLQEIIVGTGGDDHAGTPAPIAGSQVRNNKTFGVLKVGLHSGSYTWNFVPEAGQTFTDSGSRSCH